MEARLAFADESDILDKDELTNEVIAESKTEESLPVSKAKGKTPKKSGKENKENADANLDEAMLTDLANQAAPVVVPKKTGRKAPPAALAQAKAKLGISNAADGIFGDLLAKNVDPSTGATPVKPAKVTPLKAPEPSPSPEPAVEVAAAPETETSAPGTDDVPGCEEVLDDGFGVAPGV